MKIGIIGHGFVGKAVASAYEPEQLMINDPVLGDKSSSIDELIKQCEAIFICVPTPQSETGECDTSILEEVISDLAGYEGIVICKSTASPQVYRHLETFSGLSIAHVPEFLTQANYINDYLNPHKIVIGCEWTIQSKVYNILMTDKINFKGQVEFCSIAEASFFKYLANTMLAMKVIMNNEYYDLANKMGVDWESIVDISQTDPRLGTTHWQVPGPDGERGFGGACFPKDTAALASIAEDFKSEMTMLNQAIVTNIELRK